MKRILGTLSVLLVACAALSVPLRSGAQGAAPPPSAEALLKRSDRGRGAVGGITWTIESHSVEDGEQDDRSFLVKSSGNDALVEVLSPARNKGEVFLFNDHALWFVRPGLRKPISISPRQKLSGMISNGDLASTNYARDYTGTIAGEESVGAEACYILSLKARADNVTYDRIRYWISKTRGLGMKAEYRTVSDVVFKIARFEYENRLRAEGQEFAMVSRMIVTDPRAPTNTSTLRFVSPKVETHSAAMFNINNVLR